MKCRGIFYMNILIGCEESQEVCKAFRLKGHNAYSNDIQDCSGGHPEWHLKMDVREAVKYMLWDIFIFFPDCTFLTNTANKWYADQPPRKSGTLVGYERREARKKAIEFAVTLFKSNIPKISMENPIGVLSTVFRKPNQIIQPFMFGHAERKSTCLWLKNLPLLKPTNIVEPISYVANGKNYSPTHYNSKRSLNRLDCLPSGKERSKLRSKTYPGIASAMAEQWG